MDAERFLRALIWTLILGIVATADCRHKQDCYSPERPCNRGDAWVEASTKSSLVRPGEGGDAHVAQTGAMCERVVPRETL